MMVIMYHGTSEENAKIILKDGFLAGTYFATHLEDALHMGGDYIFEVYFEEKPTAYWEFITPENIPTLKIRSYYRLYPELLWHNKECEREIRKQAIKEEYDDTVIFCEECDGIGQMEYFPPFKRWRGREKITSCKKCNGHGCYNVDLEHVYDHKKFKGEL